MSYWAKILIGTPAWGEKSLAHLEHAFLVIVYSVLTRKEPYQGLGPNYFDEWERVGSPTLISTTTRSTEI